MKLNNFRIKSVDLKYDVITISIKFFMAMLLISIPFKNAFYQVSWVGLDVIFLCHIIYKKNFNIISDLLKDINILLISFIGIVVAQFISNFINPEYLNSRSWETSILFTFRYGILFLALYYFYVIKAFNITEFIIFIVISFALLIVTGICNVTDSNNAFLDKVQGGFTGGFISRNVYGMFMGFAFIFSFIFIEKPIAKLVFCAILSIFTIFTFSRSSWVAAFFATLFYCIVNFKRNKNLILIFVTLAFLVLVVLLNIESLSERFGDLIQGNSSGRYAIWKYSIDMIIQKPIFGWGIDVFLNLPERAIRIDPSYSMAHNMILEIILYTGFFGAIFYFLGIVYNIYSSFCYKEFKISTIFIYFLVIFQFDHSPFVNKPILSYIAVFSALLYASRINNNSISMRNK